jgi:phosphoglucomutase
MTIHPRAGEMASKSMLANIPRLVSTYYTHRPDISDPTQQVAFGTSGIGGRR